MEKPINGSVIPAKAGIQIVNKLDTGSGKARPVLSLPKGRCDGLNQCFLRQIRRERPMEPLNQ
jgi:hypothetical protein